MKDIKVYVYGTLRPGSTDTVIVPGTIYDLGWFPGIVMGEGETVCEVVTVSEGRLRELDRYEGFDERWPEDSLYLRQKYEDGWIYVYNNDVSGRPTVHSGDWLEYTEKRSGANSHLATGAL